MESAHVATTELSVVSGSWGKPARRTPVAAAFADGNAGAGVDGPARSDARLPGRHAAMTAPTATRMRATRASFPDPPRARACVLSAPTPAPSPTTSRGAAVVFVGATDARTNASASAPSAMPSGPHNPRIDCLVPSVHTASVHPLAHRSMPSPSCIPRTTPNGVTALNRSMSPVHPRTRTTSATNPPAATICGTSIGGSVIATAAMVFIGCSGIGTSNASAVARLYNPVNTKVVPTSRPHSAVRPTSKGMKVPRSPSEPPASRHVKSRRSSAARRSSQPAMATAAPPSACW